MDSRTQITSIRHDDPMIIDDGPKIEGVLSNGICKGSHCSVRD